MSPQRTRTYAWLFVAMSASVCVNILLLQPTSEKRRSATADNRAMRMTAGPAASRRADQLSDTVRAIQRELKELSLYPGPVDGKLSPLLHAAIIAYEQAQALPITGEPTAALLRELIVGPSTDGPAPGGQGLGVASGSVAERLIRDMRQRLAALGYAAGSGDGRLTLELSQSIRAFERDNGMAQTGRVSAQLMLKLQRSEAAFRPRPS